MKLLDLGWLVFIMIAIIPIPLLLMTWNARLFHHQHLGKIRMFSLMAATCSHAWIALAIKFPWLLAESNSSRFAIINVNILTMVFCFVIALKGPKQRVVFGIACLLTLCLWYFAAIVNVAV